MSVRLIGTRPNCHGVCLSVRSHSASLVPSSPTAPSSPSLRLPPAVSRPASPTWHLVRGAPLSDFLNDVYLRAYLAYPDHTSWDDNSVCLGPGNFGAGEAVTFYPRPESIHIVLYQGFINNDDDGACPFEVLVQGNLCNSSWEVNVQPTLSARVLINCVLFLLVWTRLRVAHPSALELCLVSWPDGQL